MSSFLDRFVGRTQTVSKLGIDQLFRGREEALIYTNTHKSFARSSTHHLRHTPLPDQPPQPPQAQQEEEPFHLPHLDQRYLNSEARRHHDDHTRSRLRLFDKDTNWLIEQRVEPQQPDPLESTAAEINRTVASVDPQKENLGRVGREKISKEERRLKSHHMQKSLSRLGGLGPNIGGEEWAVRKQKQEKAKRYAEGVKRVVRERAAQEEGGSGRVLINY